MKTYEISPDDISGLRRWIREFDATYSKELKGNTLLAFRELIQLIEDFIDLAVEGRVSAKQIFKQYVTIQAQIFKFSNNATDGSNSINAEDIGKKLSKVLSAVLTWYVQQQVFDELIY